MGGATQRWRSTRNRPRKKMLKESMRNLVLIVNEEHKRLVQLLLSKHKDLGVKKRTLEYYDTNIKELNNWIREFYKNKSFDERKIEGEKIKRETLSLLREILFDLTKEDMPNTNILSYYKKVGSILKDNPMRYEPGIIRTIEILKLTKYVLLNSDYSLPKDVYHVIDKYSKLKESKLEVMMRKTKRGEKEGEEKGENKEGKEGIKKELSEEEKLKFIEGEKISLNKLLFAQEYYILKLARNVMNKGEYIKKFGVFVRKAIAAYELASIIIRKKIKGGDFKIKKYKEINDKLYSSLITTFLDNNKIRLDISLFEHN